MTHIEFLPTITLLDQTKQVMTMNEMITKDEML